MKQKYLNQCINGTIKMLIRSTNVALCITVGCMRRFACRNFQFTTKLDSKLFYTPCYVYVWLIKVKCLIEELNKNFKRKRRVDFLNSNIYI